MVRRSYRVVWSDVAWRDLEDAADYIAQDSRAYARAFVSRVREAARSLRELPERGRSVPELGLPVRELILGNYRLLYEIEEGTVIVHGLIHGARDLRALWEREERLP